MRDGTQVRGLHYQNDIKGIHAVQKCIQNFNMLDVLSVVQNLNKMQRKYEQYTKQVNTYQLSHSKGSKSQVMNGISEMRAAKKIVWFQNYRANIRDNFYKPRNAERKPCHIHREKVKKNRHCCRSPFNVNFLASSGLPLLFEFQTLGYLGDFRFFKRIFGEFYLQMKKES